MAAIKFFVGTGGSSLYFNYSAGAHKYSSTERCLGARLACGRCAGTIRIYLEVRR